MRQKTSINKIGGAGLMLGKNDLALLIEKIVEKSAGSEIIFVISAFKGVTRILDDIFIEMIKSNFLKVEELFCEFENIHIERIKDLEIEIHPLIEKYFLEINILINQENIDENKFRFQANLLKYGELCSSLIFSEFIKKLYPHLSSLLIDARTFIIGMGSDYIHAEILQPNTIEKINMVFSENSGNIIITQGYIASNLVGCDMVLGYDGSDLTAAIIALSYLRLKPDHKVSLVYWKDIPGVYKNPRVKKDTEIFTRMKLREYLELSVYNSVPVREDSLEILARFDPQNLSIEIRSFLKLDETGTTITPYPF